MQLNRHTLLHRKTHKNNSNIINDFIYFALQMGSLLYRKQFNNELYY
jgi:hypothetical protein